jgi:hypothetical protein
MRHTLPDTLEECCNEAQIEVWEAQATKTWNGVEPATLWKLYQYKCHKCGRVLKEKP